MELDVLTAPAVTPGQMTMRFLSKTMKPRGRALPVRDYAEASRLFHGEQLSLARSLSWVYDALVYGPFGDPVAHISNNGKVWPLVNGQLDREAEPLYCPPASVVS